MAGNPDKSIQCTGWRGLLAPPDAPAGGAGPGFSRDNGPLGFDFVPGGLTGASPGCHPRSPVARLGSAPDAASGDEIQIEYGRNVVRSAVSDYTLEVLKNILRTAGLSRALITSTSRSPADQARAMYDNCESRGIASQKKLYGRAGDKVIDVYVQAKAAGKSQDQIQAAMEAEIKELGPARVSKHCRTGELLQVVDVAPSSIHLKERFVTAVKADRRVATFLRPPTDPAYHLEIPQPETPGLPEEEAPPPPVPAPPRKKEKTWIEFQFVYPDGTPVSGLDYLLEDPDGLQEGGTLGSDGLVQRKEIPEGLYTVILKGVENVAWLSKEARCDDRVKCVAQTAGYPYGTRAKIRIFREYRETDREVIQTLDGKVQNDRVEAEWKYDYTATEERKKETGVARFIAEVQLDQGKRWAKTLQPLALQLKSIDRVQWSAPRVQADGVVQLHIEAAGYPDGTPVKLELWRFDWANDNEKVAETQSARLKGGKASVACAYGKAAGDLVVKQPGEYFVIAKIDDAVSRAAHSTLLWCEPAEEEKEEAQGTARPRAA